MNPMWIMAAMSAVSALSSMGGKKEKHGSTYNKNQLSNLDQIMDQVRGMRGQGDITQNQNYQQGQDWLHGLYNDPEFYEKFEAPMQRQFQEKTVPELANRFASMGSGGSTGSTAFRNQLGRAGVDLQTNLAAQRGQMQQTGVNQGLQYAQQPFQNYMNLQQQAMTPTQNTYQGPSTGFLGGAMPGLMSGVGQAAGNYMGQNMGDGGNQYAGPSGFSGANSTQNNYMKAIAGQYPGTM